MLKRVNTHSRPVRVAAYTACSYGNAMSARSPSGDKYAMSALSRARSIPPGTSEQSFSSTVTYIKPNSSGSHKYGFTYSWFAVDVEVMAVWMTRTHEQVYRSPL